MRVFDIGGGDRPPEVTNRIWTVPNLLSLARLLVLPWLFWLLMSEQYLLGLAIGFVFASTDWLDGYVARRFDQVTRLGQLLDPVSDRLFIVTVMVALVVVDVVPLALAVAIIARDLLLLAGGALLLGGGRVTPPVTRLGKAATFGLIWSFPWLLVGAHLGTTGSGHADWVRFVGLAIAWVCTAAYWVVGVGYVRALLSASTEIDDAPPPDVDPAPVDAAPPSEAHPAHVDDAPPPDADPAPDETGTGVADEPRSGRSADAPSRGPESD